MRVLFIAAHPDDIDLSSGGTAAKWAAAGHELIYVICSNGEKGTHDRALSPFRLSELREEEQRRAGEVVGAKEVHFLRHPDGELQECRTLSMELALLIRHFRPAVLFTHDPWRPYQIHPDHRAAGMATTDAIVQARDHLFLPAVGIIGLEPHPPSELYLWGTEEPDYYEDITETIEVKLRAVAQHETQLVNMPQWEEHVRSWAVASGERAGVPFAEGFKRIVFTPANHIFPRNAEPTPSKR